MKLREKWRKLASRLAPRQQQFLVAAGILAGGVGTIWLVLALSGSGNSKGAPRPDPAKEKTVVKPEQEGIAPLRIDPVDQWVGTAGKALAQYKVDKESQDRINAERKAAEQSLMERLAELERRQQEPRPEAPPAPAVAVARPPAMSPSSAQAVRAPVSPADMPGYPPGTPTLPLPTPVPGPAPQVEQPPALVRINLAAPGAGAKSANGEAGNDGSGEDGQGDDGTLETYLPVGFIRGELLTGIMAPTGGQAQADPLPVLIRLLDNAVLPNHYRSEVKECFVIASGYGRVSDSRAYMRTVNLSCIRRDGRPTPLEVKIEGNVLGEDGMLGVQGRLITMQGQMLANALRAGIVSGIGQGFAQGGSTFTASPLGTLSTNQEGFGERMQRGVAGGVGRALDNLANYYIKLAEATFPVIEVGAKRQVHIMLTKGVKLPRLARETRDAVDD
jgi:conjugal transfer pilus assembly protein TraB